MKIPSARERHVDGKDFNQSGQQANDRLDDEASRLEETFPHYKRVSDYLLGTCIGEGSFAKVRVGFHTPTKERVAVKVINKAKAKRDSYVYKNLHREGKLLQMLRHPNIVQVYDILETGNNYYLIAELCSGGELIDIVTEEGSLPETRVCKYIKQLVDAVAYMQERRIVHRDLKVENLLLDSEDNLKIIDFGLSNILPERDSDPQSSLATQCGSPAYAAPELLAKKRYGPKVDVWSIGIITYALLVGKLPFTVSPFSIPKLCKKMSRGEMNAIPTFLSSSCRFLIRKLLTPDQAHRPTIDDVIKMKWLLTREVVNSSMKSSVGSSFKPPIARTDLVGQRLNLLKPLSNFSINPSVVREMSSSFGFTNSEVIQSVQRNRPGPALATYHLLVQKKKSNLRRKSAETEISKLRSSEPPKNQAGSEKESFSPGSDSSSSERDRDTPAVEISLDSASNCRPSSPKAKKIVQFERAAEDENRPSPQQKLSETSPISRDAQPLDVAFSLPDLQPGRMLTQRQSVDDNLNVKMKRFSETRESETEAKLDENRKRESPRSKASTITSVPFKSHTSDMSELLSDLRRVRRQKRPSLELQENVPRPPSKNPTEPSVENWSIGKTMARFSRSPHSPRKLSDNSRRSDLHKEETNASNRQQSPFKRAASHNSVLTENQASKQNQPVIVSGSPKTLRHTTDSTPFKSDRFKTNRPSAESENPSHLILPQLIPKTTERRSQPYQPPAFGRSVRPVRHSFPSPRVHQADDQYAGDQITGAKLDKPGRKSDHIATVNSSKWQKTFSKDARSNFKSHYMYYVDGRSQNPSLSRQKPKKVISEPIAAAISYLTSTKNRGFAKEKATSIPTG